MRQESLDASIFISFLERCSFAAFRASNVSFPVGCSYIYIPCGAWYGVGGILSCLPWSFTAKWRSESCCPFSHPTLSLPPANLSPCTASLANSPKPTYPSLSLSAEPLSIVLECYRRRVRRQRSKNLSSSLFSLPPLPLSLPLA